MLRILVGLNVNYLLISRCISVYLTATDKFCVRYILTEKSEFGNWRFFF
jgi:hypothetical protein